VRVLAAQPDESVAVADLLVGRCDEEEVTRRSEPLSRERREGDGVRRDLALHVERTTTPHLAVHQVARPRIAVPLGRIREDGVRVAEEREGRTVSTRNSGDEIRTLGNTGIELGLDAVPREVAGQQ